MLSFQYGQETLFEACLFRTDNYVGSTSLPGPSLQFGGKVQGTSNPQGAVVRRDCVARIPSNSSLQIVLRRLLGFDHQLGATVQEFAGGTTEQNLPLMEHH